MKKIPVAILGATGAVGQHFFAILDQHPQFEIAGLYASRPRTCVSAVPWVASLPQPTSAHRMPVEDLSIDALHQRGIRAVFCALPASVAASIEMQLVQSGIAVFSNASAHRMDPDVPIVIPEINAPHLDLCPCDRALLVTNSNCSASGLTMVLRALEPLGLRTVHVATYQSVSGAGYPGVASLDILGNVVPHIPREDEKIAMETRKMLGTLQNGRIVEHPTQVIACAARVPTLFGHLETVFIQVETPCDEAKVGFLLRSFRGHEAARELFSSPHPPIEVFEDPARPQPRLDVMRGNGMTVSVGGIRCMDGTISLRLLVNNVIRGAAGGSVQNAELALATGRL